MLKRRAIQQVLSILSGLSFFIFLSSCGASQDEKEQALTKTYCSTCHLFPEPSLLDKQTWEKSVLPRMAFRMGFPDFDILSELSESDLPVVLKSLPPRPLVSEEDWNMIKNYYLKNAPDSLTNASKIISDTIIQFLIRPVNLSMEPQVTFIKIDTTTHSIYVGNRNSTLYKLNSNFDLTDTFLLPSPVSWLNPDREKFLATTMGIMDPNDQARGQLITFDKDTSLSIIDSLKRPVYFESCDMNADGNTDYVICAFGNYLGDLSVYEKSDDGYVKHILSPLPGARKVIVKDFNGDKRPDVLALMTQGDEQIILFKNNGDFTFESDQLLRFPPVYGSTYFEINDFNGDGYFDILTVNGDNADYSPIVKPYHALRIFENDGKNNFNEKWSFSMPGASMAMARDYDEDGDLDIAAISYFPDFEKNSQGSLIYFENSSDYRFIPQVTKLATYGRWLVMDADDIDGDGDCDILVGALNFNGMGARLQDYKTWRQHQTSILVLQNKLFNK